MSTARFRPAAACGALLAGALACVSSVAVAKPERYVLDPVHTQVLFFVSHLGFSQQMGRFPGVTGEFTFDRDDWSSARVDATIDIASLYLGDAAWQKKVLGDFFAVEAHPTARFTSERVERIDDDHARVAGTLTLRGVSRPLVLDVTRNRVGRHSFSLKYVAGFSATATIRRADFGMTRLLPAVGDEVQLRLEVEGLRERDDKE